MDRRPEDERGRLLGLGIALGIAVGTVVGVAIGVGFATRDEGGVGDG